MTEENPIEHGRGMIQELRARQKWHSYQEIELAKEIQRHIHAQSALEDELRAWQIHIELIHKEKGITDFKSSESGWDRMRKRITF